MMEGVESCSDRPPEFSDPTAARIVYRVQQLIDKRHRLTIIVPPMRTECPHRIDEYDADSQ